MLVTPEAAEAAVQTVRRFRMLAEAAGATEILACATSALRSATNGDAVLDQIEAEAGVSADVIDGLEEARLIFTAIRTAVLIDPGPALCFDLGGGSVEIMVGDTTGLHWAASERLGVARLSAEYVRSDPISKGDRRRLREHLVEILGPLAVDVMRFEPKLAIGSSGTLEDIAHMVAERRDESVPRSLNQLTLLPRGVRAAPPRAGPLDVRAAPDASRGSTRSGSISSSPARSSWPRRWSCSRWTSSRSASGRCAKAWSSTRSAATTRSTGRTIHARSDARPCRRSPVASRGRRSTPATWRSSASSCSTRPASCTGSSDTDRELLEYAALLHDIGEHVSHDGHDRHAAYLVAHGQLRGFDPEEILVLTALVRWHRRGEPKANDDLVGELDAEPRERVRRLAALHPDR